MEKRTKKILEKLGVFAGTLLLLFVLYKFAIYFMPFLIAGIIAIIIEPVIKFCMNKLKMSRRMSSFIVIGVTIITFVTIVVFGSMALVKEVFSLSKEVGPYIADVSQNVMDFVDNLNTGELNIDIKTDEEELNEDIVSNTENEETDQKEGYLSPEIVNAVKNSLASFFNEAGTYISSIISKLLQMLLSIPTMLIYITITILALIFFTKDRVYVIDLLEHHFPKKWLKNIQGVVGETLSTLGSYIRVYAKIIVITFAELFLALNIYRLIGFDVSYPFLLAVIIAIIDILPILGVGTVLIPWALWLFITGEFGFGIAVLLTYITIYIIRQFIEPKLVSKQLGVHPLVTLFAMYTGFRMAGVFGLILGPITLMILKFIFAKPLEKGLFKDLFDEK